ncbi:MAG TPA: N-acetyltransferase, partial [Elusimicrobia bacterium]|nr:N-acetyltransferase [Elusimicrobiota bacterium]
FFGFFESINDYAVAEKLLNVVREYLKEKKMEVMRGPMNPSTNDECGFLIEGFDSAPTVMMTYNPEYYLEFMERYGLRKAKDFYAYLAPVTGEQITRLSRVSELVKKREPNLVVRPINLKKFAEELGKIKQIYNSAWSKNWGFVPMTDGEIESMAERLKPLVVPEILQIAEFDGKPAGFLMAVPDYNQVMKRINGKLNLSGIVKFLWYKNKIDALRLITLGVCPEYRKKGIDGLLYLESLKGAMKKGYKFCEFSWVLEENILTQ